MEIYRCEACYHGPCQLSVDREFDRRLSACPRNDMMPLWLKMNHETGEFERQEAMRRQTVGVDWATNPFTATQRIVGDGDD